MTKLKAKNSHKEKITLKTPMKAKDKSTTPAKKAAAVQPKAAVVSTPKNEKADSAEKSSKANVACVEKAKPSQNWLLFKSQLQEKRPLKPPHWRKRTEKQARAQKGKFSDNVTDIVAIDCEMVGGGESGRENLLARVSVVNKFNEVLYDTFVKPLDTVTDYRTQYSGVRESDLATATEFKEAQAKVAALIDKKILVGHDIKNDLKVLFLGHPANKIRDTSKFKTFKELKFGRLSLKYLAEKVLGIKIQQGEHDSVEDAKATMSLYMMHQNEWEKIRKEKKAPRAKVEIKEQTRKNWDRANNSEKWHWGHKK